MPATDPRSRTGADPAAGAVATAVVLASMVLAPMVLAGCAGPSDAPDPASPATGSPTGSATSSPTGQGTSAGRKAAEEFRSVRTYQPVALPVRLRIPAAGVDAALVRVGLDADGLIAAPTAWGSPAWYRKGPRPGQDGPAVIVGHVDSKAGPAVFFRLDSLSAGDRIRVDRADGSAVTFRVTGKRQVAKASFPAAQVYSPTLEPSLVLITCGGTFDPSVGHYRDNVLVTAVPA